MNQVKEIWIFSTANPFDFDVEGVYESEESLLKELEHWDIYNVTMDEVMDPKWQRENEVKIEKSIIK